MELAVGDHGVESLERLVQAARDGKCLEYDLEHNKDFFRTDSQISHQSNGKISRESSQTVPLDRAQGKILSMRWFMRLDSE